MCYRCEICATVVPPKRVLLRHNLYREVRKWVGTEEKVQTQIAQEIKVCSDCATELKYLPYRQVLKRKAPARDIPIEKLEEARPYEVQAVPVPTRDSKGKLVPAQQASKVLERYVKK